MSVAHMLRSARRRSGLSARALATQAGTSHATILAYESGRKVPRADTMLRILDAAGFDATLVPTTRPDADRSARRAKGEELAQVLLLAEQFPTRHDHRMTYPRFGRVA